MGFKKPEQLEPQNKPVTEPSSPTIGLARPADLPECNHYASRNREQLEREYRYLWSICKLHGPQADESRKHALFILRNRQRLIDFVTKNFPGMPWHLVGIINVLEGGLSFDNSLLNGDPWNKVTTHFPSGKGPWVSWEDAALYALVSEAKGWNFNLKTWNWKDVGEYLFFCEAWNGFNARMEPQYSLTNPHGASPYVYSGTDQYVKGKKQEQPTRFNPDLVSQQPGVMAILRALQELGVEVFA